MNISASIRKVTQLFIILFIALSGGLVYWQVVVAQQVAGNIHNGRHCLSDNAPFRGRILDRNGVVLAESKPAPSTRACGYLRHYYLQEQGVPSLAALIGYYISPLFPSTGIEAKYDDYLSGRLGLTALDNTINQTLHRPSVGDDVYLTIDVRIQRIVDKYFDEPITIDNNNTFATDRGSVIVTNPHTGEVLAMLSRPTFDPNRVVSTISAGDFSYFNQLQKDRQQPLIERPIQNRYPPGSIYKTATLLAGLDSGHTTLNQEFNEKQALGPIYFNGQRFGPDGNNIAGYTHSYPVNTEYGFTHSDNIIFAQIGVNTGASTWLDYNKRFYVGQKIPFDLPVTPSSVLKNGQSLADNELAANAFGQGYDFVTPMQMSLLDNAVANDGQLMRPMLVLKVADSNQSPIQTYSPQTLSSPVTSQTATEVRQGMYGVVRCGSGSLYNVRLVASPWGIIGKTGTAQVSDRQDVPAHSWLITQAPYSVNNPSQLPALTIVAMKENGGEGGAADGPMVTDMYNDIFTNVLKSQLPPTPDPNYCTTTRLLQ